MNNPTIDTASRKPFGSQYLIRDYSTIDIERSVFIARKIETKNGLPEKPSEQKLFA